MNIQDLLLKKYSSDDLGHFYILTPNRNTADEEFLTHWTYHLIQNFLETKKVANHEDFIEIKPSRPNGKYSIDDLGPLFNGLNYSATRAKRKIILIHSADMFTSYVSNKLLKTLEEPPIKSTIFLLNPNRATLLQTIASRGIKLRIPIKTAENLEDHINYIKELKQISTHSIIDKLKNNIADHHTTLSALSSWCIINDSHFATYSQIEKIIKEFKEDELFHNAPTHRLFALATLIKELPL